MSLQCVSVDGRKEGLLRRMPEGYDGCPTSQLAQDEFDDGRLGELGARLVRTSRSHAGANE